MTFSVVVLSRQLDGGNFRSSNAEHKIPCPPTAKVVCNVWIDISSWYLLLEHRVHWLPSNISGDAPSPLYSTYVSKEEEMLVVKDAERRGVLCTVLIFNSGSKE